MDTMPEFSIPGVSADEADETLEALAAFAGCSVPRPGKRVYRIEWIHDGQQWTAEVGRPLRGVQVSRTSRGRPGRRFTDPATTQAIFPGMRVWLVVTDAHPLGDVRSAWENPFMAGLPDSVQYFREPGNKVAREGG